MSETKLILPNGKSCETLEQLRKNYTDDWIISVIEDGTLLAWLKAMYYEKEAECVSNIDRSQRDEVLLTAFRKAMGITETEVTNEARQRLSEFTDDPELLKKAESVAYTQSDLAQLLDKNCKDILLCGGTFNIPLSKCDVTYTAVGNLVITAPSRVDMAKNHIRLNGYKLADDTAHSGQLTELIEKISISKYKPHYYLTSDYSGGGNRYDSKYECLEKRNSIVSKAYREASKYLNASENCCIAKAAANYYSDKIKEVFEENKRAIYKLGATDEQMSEMISLCDFRKTLLKACEEELNTGDYYRLYKQSYFEELIDVEEFEELREGVFFEWNLRKVKTYYLTNCYKPRDELEKDVNELAEQMWSFAYNEFLRTVQEPVIKLLTEIGKAENVESA